MDFLIPGLFGPVPIQPGDVAETPVLSRLLGRADRVPAPAEDPVSALMARFRITPDAGFDPPSAPFCFLADTGGLGSDDFVLHADPVHLRLDRDRLVLFDGRHLDLAQGEADALSELFNDHFANDGLRLDVPNASRWYLRVASRPRIRTSPLHAVVGRSVNASLPQGVDAVAWARILNETQMLFHHSSVNRDREQAGRLAVSGIWPWGGGRLSEWTPRSDYECAFGDHPLIVGLASAAGTRAEGLPDDAQVLLRHHSADNSLVFWHALWHAVLGGDGASWTEELRRLEDWLSPLPECVKPSRVGYIDFHTCSGRCFRLHRRGLWRFWRSPLRIDEQMAIRLPGASR